jgi:hypothetical protein
MEHTTILQVENIYSRLITTDRELAELLHKKLRFRPPNYWHNSAYKRKIWDGWKEFYDLKSGKFYTGLLPEVQAALRVLDKPYQLIDPALLSTGYTIQLTLIFSMVVCRPAKIRSHSMTSSLIWLTSVFATTGVLCKLPPVPAKPSCSSQSSNPYRPGRPHYF